jgi:hypothetical protein
MSQHSNFTPDVKGWTHRQKSRPRSSIGSVNRRDVGFLIIGVGLGLLLSLAVVLEVMLSLRDGSSLSGYAFDKIAFLIPTVLLVLGVILLAYRKKSERDSN